VREQPLQPLLFVGVILLVLVLVLVLVLPGGGAAGGGAGGGAGGAGGAAAEGCVSYLYLKRTLPAVLYLRAPPLRATASRRRGRSVPARPCAHPPTCWNCRRVFARRWSDVKGPHALVGETPLTAEAIELHLPGFIRDGIRHGIRAGGLSCKFGEVVTAMGGGECVVAIGLGGACSCHDESGARHWVGRERWCWRRCWCGRRCRCGRCRRRRSRRRIHAPDCQSSHDTAPAPTLDGHLLAAASRRLVVDRVPSVPQLPPGEAVELVRRVLLVHRHAAGDVGSTHVDPVYATLARPLHLHLTAVDRVQRTWGRRVGHRRQWRVVRDEGHGYANDQVPRYDIVEVSGAIAEKSVAQAGGRCCG
jgi:hypothetical protein